MNGARTVRHHSLMLLHRRRQAAIRRRHTRGLGGRGCADQLQSAIISARQNAAWVYLIRAQPPIEPAHPELGQLRVHGPPPW